MESNFILINKLYLKYKFYECYYIKFIFIYNRSKWIYLEFILNSFLFIIEVKFKI